VILLKKPLNLNLSKQDALIIADVQKDFLPGGTLPVKDGDLIIPALNEYAKIFKEADATIIASRDWHPPNHMSFVDQGGPWVPHCVQDTEGASFSPDLKLPEGTMIVSKATNPQKEAYSVFDGTGLDEELKKKGTSRVFIGGLATDYCVLNSTLDAKKLGYEIVVLADATRGIDVNPGDVEKAFETMAKNGALQITLADFPETEALPESEGTIDVEADKPLVESYVKKKARMRSKGSYKRVRRERG
jgi:nicotinamidase/pyrazinamidase